MASSLEPVESDNSRFPSNPVTLLVVYTVLAFNDIISSV